MSTDTHGYTHLDIFSGLGGFALAARRAGFQTLAFCESNPRCRRFLDRTWGLPVHEDIRTLDGRSYRGVDLLTGGPPCQPSSRAGNQRGADDDRWLWGEAIRVVDETRPHGFLFETPLGILDLDFDGILASLEGCGYEVQTFNIPASAVNSPQIRERLWIVGFMGDAMRAASGRDAGTVPRSQTQERQDGGVADRHGITAQGMADAAGASGTEQQRESREEVGRKTTPANSAEREGPHQKLADAESRRFGIDGRTSRSARHVDERVKDRSMADAGSQPARTGKRRDAQGSRSEHRDDASGRALELADPASPRHQRRHAERGADGRAAECAGTVADAEEQHRRGRIGQTQERGRRTAVVADPERERRLGRALASGLTQEGQEWRETFDAACRLHWDAHVWVPCDDGYVRRAPDQSVGVVNGLSRSVLEALGNAIVPQEAYEIIKLMKEFL